jgi:peptidylprolyl isomerase
MSPLRACTIAAVLIIATLLLTSGCTQSAGKTVATTVAGTPTMSSTDQGQKLVRLETTMGNIVIALDPNMPTTAGNFESLVRKGFYAGVIFHRVIDKFMIQGGDPTGTGRGGPGYMIKDEFAAGNQNNRGTISMANAGPNTGGDRSSLLTS